MPSNNGTQTVGNDEKQTVTIEDPKLPGAGIAPKLCAMERVGTEINEQNVSIGDGRTGGMAGDGSIVGLALNLLDAQHHMSYHRGNSQGLKCAYEPGLLTANCSG